jgi:Domain of unknown function (DUF4232)
MMAPPKQPSHEEPEALIEEARARQLRRRLLGAAAVAIAAAVAFGAYALAEGPTQEAATASGSPARAATACGVAGGWRLRPDGLWSEPTGQHTVPLAVTRTGSQPCTLDGYPTVVLLDSFGQRLAFTYSHRGDQVVTSRAPGVVHVEGHGSAYFMVDKYRCDIRSRSAARWVRVKLPGVSGWLVTQLTERIIDFCPAEPPSGTIAVSPLVGELIQASRQPSS